MLTRISKKQNTTRADPITKFHCNKTNEGRPTHCTHWALLSTHQLAPPRTRLLSDLPWFLVQCGNKQIIRSNEKETILVRYILLFVLFVCVACWLLGLFALARTVHTGIRYDTNTVCVFSLKLGLKGQPPAAMILPVTPWSVGGQTRTVGLATVISWQ